MYKVVGIGDSGLDILKMVAANKRVAFFDIETIVINTHSAAFSDSLADTHLLLNQSGLGAAGNPMVGRESAEASKDMLFDALGYAKRIYITCGMGGGTGTGAAHVVAFVAKELRIPCIAVVSTPFSFESLQRKKIAELGMKALSHFADEMIVIDPMKVAQESSGFVGVLPSIEQSFRALSAIMAEAILKHIAKDSSAAQS